jgi:hypothetical protein
MIGCGLLSDISEALSIAKGNTDSFGGINIIFAGDFAQLPPGNAPLIVSENSTKDAFNIKAAHAFAKRTGRPLHWYHASDTVGRNKPQAVSNPDLIRHLQGMDSGATNSRLGKIPLVIGMPVMISQNFDVHGGVVNGCYGSLRSVRYRVDRNGNRHAPFPAL